MRQFIKLVEADIEFERGADKVVAKLKSYNSQVYTKLAQKVERIEALEDEIKALKAEVKSGAREHVNALFDAEDVVRTRVVDTVSFILTLSKDPKPTETVQYAKVITELEKSLTPELILILENLKAQFKTVTQKEPSLKIIAKPKDDLEESMHSYQRKFDAFIHQWAERYDDKLDSLKQLVSDE